MYRVAIFLLDHWWGQHAKMTDALAVLLLTWNQAHYRYGMFDQGALEASLKRNWSVIDAFHKRDIASFVVNDVADIALLFNDLLDALKTARGTRAGAVTPVGVGKTLHLLAPHFFPPWDKRIADAYDCRYSSDPAEAYLRFVHRMKSLADNLRSDVRVSERSILKQIDEYNYARQTQGWI
jgi:hypothetical protein